MTMTTQLAFWDLEIGFEHPGQILEAAAASDIWDIWPFGVSVGAVAYSEADDVSVWYDKIDDRFLPMWSTAYTESFLEWLATSRRRLFAWNGTGFDWQLLARLTGNYKLCVDLCLQSYDPCFQVFCMTGYPVGLSTAALALGLPEKEIEGWSAPIAWAAGDHQTVIEYVTGDVLRLRGIIQGIVNNYGLKWRPGKGGVRYLPFDQGFLTVEQCLCLPLPDTSWMDRKPSAHPRLAREDFIQWWND